MLCVSCDAKIKDYFEGLYGCFVHDITGILRFMVDGWNWQNIVKLMKHNE